MDKDLKVSKSITINATAEQVWDALVNPEKIKKYLFGTEAISSWLVDDPIIFQGEYQGQKYKDKGNVLENKPYKTLKYNYWSGFSGIEDKPENYSIITYTLNEIANGEIKFTWKQEGFSSKQGCEHTERTLYGMLEQIKKVVEGE